MFCNLCIQEIVGIKNILLKKNLVKEHAAKCCVYGEITKKIENTLR
jgi:hypothetical protein